MIDGLIETARGREIQTVIRCSIYSILLYIYNNTYI